ncbi:MAG: DUF6452 family protein [Bacteroides sp.]|jgi:hypothetical protein|nr:DUF6452 family protein [Bacteroides sp.]
MRHLKKLILISLVAYPVFSLFLSCSEEEDCSMNARPMTKCYLYTQSGSTILNDTLDSLTITALGTDSIIINNQKKVHDLSLPLRYTVDSTALILHYSKTLSDTVIIYQTNVPYFLSMNCGYQMKQTINKVSYSTHKLDSISIKNAEAGINEKENLKLFY